MTALLLVMSIGNWLPALPAAANVIIAIGGAAGVIAACYKILRRLVNATKTTRRKFQNLYDSLVGFEELVDPQTGAVVRGPIPGLNARVSVIEHWQAQTTTTLERMAVLLERQQTLEQRLIAHEEWSRQWIAEHEARCQQCQIKKEA